MYLDMEAPDFLLLATADSIASAHPSIFSEQAKHGARKAWRAAPYAPPAGVAKGLMAMRNLAPAPHVAPAAPSPRDRKWQRPPPPMSNEPLREQDRLLPMANVARLMACELPRNAKISRDAKTLMQEMVSEFICFVTSEANDLSLMSHRKALSPDDILSALEALGTEPSQRSNQPTPCRRTTISLTAGCPECAQTSGSSSPQSRPP